MEGQDTDMLLYFRSSCSLYLKCVFMNYRKATDTSMVGFFILNTSEITAKILSVEIYNAANVSSLTETWHGRC